MSNAYGRKIAELFINLNMNLAYWTRVHLEEVFNVSGKGEDQKLTMQQLSFLICIRDYELNTISQLADALCLSKSSASLSIAKMVEKGYLTKEFPAKEDDGRKIYLHLTEKGKSAAQATEDAMIQITSKYFNAFDEEKKEAIFDHLNSLNQLINNRRN